MVIKYFITLQLIFILYKGKSQSIEIEPYIGFHYTGISSLSGSKPEDFKASRPEFEPTIGVQINYSSKNLTHILKLQNFVLGSSFSFENIYLDKGIIPTFQEHAHSDGIDVLLVSYHVQKQTHGYGNFLGRTTLKFTYSGGVGIGFNRSQLFYDNNLQPYGYGGQVGTNYYNYTINYSRLGSGIFLIGMGGIELFNKKRKHYLSFNLFWNQGIKNMEEFSISYDYGYSNTPYQRQVNDVKVKSKGTTFGLTLGMPIRVVNERRKAD